MLFDLTGVLPVFIIQKHPVPYVFFTSPCSTHNWPNKAACWSPAIPQISIGCLKIFSEVFAIFSEQETTLGRIFLGISKIFSSSSSHCNVLILNSKVLLALVISVTCLSPFVKFQINQLSTVPKAISPFSACFLNSGSWSKIHFIFVPEK